MGLRNAFSRLNQIFHILHLFKISLFRALKQHIFFALTVMILYTQYSMLHKYPVQRLASYGMLPIAELARGGM